MIAGSISRATKLVGLSQPTISQTISRLEEELGTPLLYRKRGVALELTPAGEFWHRSAEEMINRRAEILSRHAETYRRDQYLLRFGVTPSLRGQFVQAAASIAVQVGRFSGFEHMMAVNSVEVLQMLENHTINCGVLSKADLQGRAASYHVEWMFSNRSVWAVPSRVSDETVAGALSAGAAPDSALDRYVRLSVSIPWAGEIEQWYARRLPKATPYFRCMTHEVAMEFVAAGEATAHCPISLIPYLNEPVRQNVKFFEVAIGQRDAVLVMPRHLTSLRPFRDFARNLLAYTRKTFPELEDGAIRPLPVQPE